MPSDANQPQFQPPSRLFRRQLRNQRLCFGVHLGSADSSASVVVSGADLIATGLRVEVREGGAGGTSLAHLSLLYTNGISRAVLCKGGLFTSMGTGSVSGLSYYLEPL